MNLRILRDIFFANWKEKLLSVLLAILFWFMIKAQVDRRPFRFGGDLPTPASRL